MVRVGVMRLAAAIAGGALAVSGLGGAQGASAHSAHSVQGAEAKRPSQHGVAQGWVLTPKAPPQATSAAGGARLRANPSGTDGGPSYLLRYNTATHPKITATRQIATREHILGTYIDKAGTIVAVAKTDHVLWGLSWRRGEPATPWVKLADDLRHGCGEGCGARLFHSDSDDAGDVLAVAATNDGWAYSVFRERTGWATTVDLDRVSQKYILELLGLAPDGQIYAEATPLGVEGMLTLWRPLGGDSWTTRKLSPGMWAPNYQLDAGPGHSMAVQDTRFPHTTGLEVYSAGMKTVARHRVSSHTAVACAQSVGRGQARFVVFDTEPPYQLRLITYDGHWSVTATLPFGLESHLTGCVERAGGALALTWQVQDGSITRTADWPVGKKPQVQTVVAGRLSPANAGVLPRGGAWIRMYNIHHHVIEHVLYAVKYQ